MYGKSIGMKGTEYVINVFLMLVHAFVGHMVDAWIGVCGAGRGICHIVAPPWQQVKQPSELP